MMHKREQKNKHFSCRNQVLSLVSLHSPLNMIKQIRTSSSQSIQKKTKPRKSINIKQFSYSMVKLKESRGCKLQIQTLNHNGQQCSDSFQLPHLSTIQLPLLTLVLSYWVSRYFPFIFLLIIYSPFHPISINFK